MPCMCKYDSDNGELASPNCSFFFFVSPFFNLCIDTGRLPGWEARKPAPPKVI